MFGKKSGLTVHKEIYISACRHVNKLIEQAKKTFFKNKFNCVKSCKELFTTVNYLFGKKVSSPLPNVSDTGNASQFSKFFIDKIDTIRLNLDNTPCSLPDFTTFTDCQLISFDLTNETEIKKLILDSPTKHCDLDPLPTNLLKQCISDLLPAIVSIINESLQSGVVPICFKNALVKPLLKKPGLDPNILKNFRPVSNLSFLSKILEKVILNRLLLHFEQNNLNEVYQSAYKKFHSTETALIKVFNDIACDLDKRNVVLQSLLDLSAAFDTIDHEIMVSRLELSFGIKGTALAWFRSYLSLRRQSVQVGSVFSENALLKYGVPQGSVLGPILFTLYTTPLSNIFQKYNIDYHLYADDSQLYKGCKFDYLDKIKEQNEHCIEDVKIWMDSNKLKLNNDKTELIVFKNKHQIKDHIDETICINDIEIQSSCVIKNLGVIFDEDLSMTSHVKNVCKSITFQLGKISSIRKFITTDVTKTLVTSLILSRFDYCNSLFCSMTSENIDKLQLLQNHAARLIFGKKKRDHITPILIKLHWLPIHQRIKYKVALLCFKCIHNLAPIYLQNLLEIYTPSRCLRSSNDNFLLKKVSMQYKSYGEKSFSFYGPIVWNSLPFDLRSTSQLSTFKKQLKTFLFKKAYSE